MFVRYRHLDDWGFRSPSLGITRITILAVFAIRVPRLSSLRTSSLGSQAERTTRDFYVVAVDENVSRETNDVLHSRGCRRPCCRGYCLSSAFVGILELSNVPRRLAARRTGYS